MRQSKRTLLSKTLIILITSSWLALQLIHAETFAQAPADPQTESPSHTVEQLNQILGKLPGGKRLTCMVKDFSNIIKPGDYDPNNRDSVLVSNAGLGDYIASLAAHSPEYQYQLNDFYNALKKKIYRGESRPKNASDNLKRLPSIEDESGDGSHSSLKPGWLWSLALEKAHGNSTRAIELIAACGHDDTEQGGTLVRLTLDEQKVRYKEQAKVLDEAIKQFSSKNEHQNKPLTATKDDCMDLNSDMKWRLEISSDQVFNDFSSLLNCHDPIKAKKLLADIKSFRKEITPESFQQTTLNCPSGIESEGQTDFFLPKSLGAKVDISPSMKKRIVNTSDMRCPEHSEDPAPCIPAKYYHIYGSALVACEMISEGHDPLAVIELSKIAGWYYRVLTLSEIAKKGDPADHDMTPLQGWLTSMKESLEFGTQKNACGSPSQQEVNTPNDLPDEKNLADAMELMRRWTLSGDFGKSIGMVYTNIVTNPLEAADLWFGLELGRPAGWSDARFKRAKAELKNVFTDFSWTTDQHRIGAEFAASVCKPDPAKKLNACK